MRRGLRFSCPGGRRAVARAVAAAAAALGAAVPVQGQQRGPVIVGGSASVTADAYSQSGLPADRRPGQSLLLAGTLNLGFGGQFTLPLSFHVSTQGSGYQQPFNQLGISPRWSWGQAHAGYFSTKLTDLTLQSARLLGGGIELQPGIFRLAVVSGVSQQAVEPDSLLNRRGLFRQRMTAAQVGLGRSGGARLWLSGLRARDDLTSLTTGARAGTGVLRPQENLVASVSFALPIAEKFSVEGEVAGSGYSEDIEATPLAEEDLAQIPALILDLFTPLTSSRADLAANAAVKAQPTEAFGLAVEARYAGPGYRSLGATQVEVDVLDFTVSPRIQTSRVSLDLSVGRRRNNVAETRESTTERAIVNATALVRASDALSFTGQFTNYGLRASNDNDTLRVDNVSRLVSLAPAYRFQTGRYAHDVQGNYSFQEFSDNNVVTGPASATSSHGVSASHTLTLPSGVSLTTSASRVDATTAGLLTATVSYQESVAFTALERRLRVNGTLGFTRTAALSVDDGLLGNLRATYKIDGRQQLQAGAQYRKFDFGRPRGGITGYTEVLLRAGYTISF